MDSKIFGENLRKIRKEKGLTLEELGEKAGFTKSYLSILENGKQGIPRHETIGKLANGLGISEIELLVAAGFYRGRLVDEFGSLIDLNFVLTQEPNVCYKNVFISDDDRELLLKLLNRIIKKDD